jgi:hypothetical protein
MTSYSNLGIKNWTLFRRLIKGVLEKRNVRPFFQEWGHGLKDFFKAKKLTLQATWEKQPMPSMAKSQTHIFVWHSYLSSQALIKITRERSRVWGTLRITFHENIRLSELRKALIVQIGGEDWNECSHMSAWNSCWHKLNMCNFLKRWYRITGQQPSPSAFQASFFSPLWLFVESLPSGKVP